MPSQGYPSPRLTCPSPSAVACSPGREKELLGSLHSLKGMLMERDEEEEEEEKVEEEEAEEEAAAGNGSSVMGRSHLMLSGSAQCLCTK